MHDTETLADYTQVSQLLNVITYRILDSLKWKGLVTNHVDPTLELFVAFASLGFHNWTSICRFEFYV